MRSLDSFQALKMDFKRIIIPLIETSFVRVDDEIEVVTVQTIQQLCDYLNGQFSGGDVKTSNYST